MRNFNFSDQSLPRKEISINPSDVFNLKINPRGLIEYANHRFCEVSGYEEHELIGESLDFIKHPDMPLLFFEVINERLAKKENIRVFMKFFTKDNNIFWMLMDFETKTDENGNPIAHYAHGKAAPQYGISKMESIYKILSKIERKTNSTEASRNYLVGFLEERNISYNKFIEELCARSEDDSIKVDNNLHSITDTSHNIKFDMSIHDKLNRTNAINYENYYSNVSHPKKKANKKTLMKKLFGK